MSFNAFTFEKGTTQGRAQTIGFAPVGLFAFVLGRDVAGLSVDLNIGDYAEASQIADFAGTKLVRFKSRLRPPTALPAGASWKFSLRIDGAEMASQIMAPGRTRDRLDMAANVTGLAVGSHTLAFRLEVIAA
jgi:hypothetical protein